MGIMNHLPNKELYTFKYFEKIDEESKCFDLAWPVEVIECYANKISDEELNSLALAVLKLLAESSFSSKRISNLLHVGEIIINDIFSELETKEFYNKETKEVTNKGKDYISGHKNIDFSKDEIFGNIFMSKVDGEILPFFYAGKLPEGYYYKSDDLVYLNFKNNFQSKNIENLSDRINHAYHDYKLIYRNSVHNEDEEDFRDPTEKQIQSEIELKKARIQTLNTERKTLYLKTRIVVKKYAPETFIVESPFMNNETTWFNLSFNRYVSDNISVTYKDKEMSLPEWTKNISSLFYIEFPELQKSNFEQWCKVHFPYLSLSSGDKMINSLPSKFKEVFRLDNLYSTGDISKRSVINEYSTTIEQILNCYIMKTDRNTVVNKYITNAYNKYKSQTILKTYGIYKAKAYGKINFYKDRDTGNLQENVISSFIDDNNCGRSITEKYYYLIIDYYFQKNTPFGKLLSYRNNDKYNNKYSLIEALDNLQDTRNQYGSHSSGPIPPEMPDSGFNEFRNLFNVVANDLLKFYMN